MKQKAQWEEEKTKLLDSSGQLKPLERIIHDVGERMEDKIRDQVQKGLGPLEKTMINLTGKVDALLKIYE